MFRRTSDVCAPDDPLDVSQETVGRPFRPMTKWHPPMTMTAKFSAGKWRTLLPRPVHLARLLRRPGIQRAARLPRMVFIVPAIDATHKSAICRRSRKKDLINRGGEKSREEIENLILFIIGQDASCVPSPIRYWASACAHAFLLRKMLS